MTDQKLESIKKMIEDAEELRDELASWQGILPELTNGQIRYVCIPMVANQGLRVVNSSEQNVESCVDVPVSMINALRIMVLDLTKSRISELLSEYNLLGE